MEEYGYKHKVQYYETDQMGVVHHSNYIRWFEEAELIFWIKLVMGIGKWKSRELLVR